MEGQIIIKKIAVNLSLASCNDTVQATTEVTTDDNIEKYEYQIDSGDWKEGSATQNIIVSSGGKHTIKVRVTAGSKTAETSQEIDMPSVTILGKQIAIATCENGIYKVEHKDETGLSADGWKKEEYRFAGVNYTDESTPYVHNYVNFNNEKWRIIGLVNVKTEDGTYEQRLKIVRTDGINGQKDFGSYQWNSEYNNDWTTSSLKNMLNGIYYNSGNGSCYTDDSAASTCDFASGIELPKGLNETAREMVDDGVTWNLGGTDDYQDSSNGLVTNLYNYERGTTVPSSHQTEWSATTDPTEHKGVGLIYPSDYGYASHGGSKGRAYCFAKELYNWDATQGDYQTNCANNDWLKPSGSSSYLWTITPFSGYSDGAFNVYSEGFLYYYDNVTDSGVVWPVVYLKSNVKIVDGTGEINNPYQLSVQN